MKLILALVILVIGCGPTAIVDQLPDGNPILIRSPQPDSDDLHELQTKYQLRTVINLRGERLAEWYVDESLTCALLGIRLIDIKASGRHPPSNAQIQEFLEILKDKSNYPILLHCQGGIHRTGVYIAIYRLMVQHWAPNEVLAELEDNYFDWTVEDRSAIKEWIRNFSP